jgi:hypothetical protein
MTMSLKCLPLRNEIFLPLIDVREDLLLVLPLLLVFMAGLCCMSLGLWGNELCVVKYEQPNLKNKGLMG